VALFCNPASGGTFSSTAIEIIKWVKKFAYAQAKVTHILRPGKASEKTPKGVIPPSLCEISQNALREGPITPVFCPCVFDFASMGSLRLKKYSNVFDVGFRCHCQITLYSTVKNVCHIVTDSFLERTFFSEF
jgi:hypothetical protein